MTRRITAPAPALPGELRLARRAIIGIEQFALLRDWEWNRSIQNWVLHCRLSPDIQTGSLIPHSTDWFVHVSPAYPFGEIKFFPAKEGGLTATFPHQKYNEAGHVDLPWRTGCLCLDTPAHTFKRRELNVEPYEAQQRLSWHVHRACQWLEDASRGELALPGEPFELPDFPIDLSLPFSVAFIESSDSLFMWNEVPEQAGIVEYYVLRRKINLHVVRSFQSLNGHTLIAHEWGRSITDDASLISHGFWLKLTETPVLTPWQAPATWGELRLAFEHQGINLDSLLHTAFKAFRQKDEIGRIALIGFPLPARLGDPPECMHWQALHLPELIPRDGQVRGFRHGHQRIWPHNRERVLHNGTAAKWLPSENWHSDQLTTRGVLPMNLTSRKILLLGAGALGAAVAEMLVRAGVSRLLIVDGDLLKAGNLTRHTLDLRDLNDHKAAAVAKRLNQVSPQARVEAMNQSFPPANSDEKMRLTNCEVVIDCTGSDEVLQQMASFDWDSEKLFFSASMSLGARRLYCFAARGRSFPSESFRQQITPWLTRDFSENADTEMPREGIGCWHPIFPARADDVWMMAAVAVKQLEQTASFSRDKSEIIVYEQHRESGELFSGIRKVSTETGDE